MVLEPLEQRTLLSAGPAIAGGSTVVAGDPYMLHLFSGDQTPSSWTIYWGDGSEGDSGDVIEGNPSMASHIYTGEPSAYDITATANGVDAVDALVSGGGDFLGKFAPNGFADPADLPDGMRGPIGLAFGPDGTSDGISDLYVTVHGGNVAIVDGVTGEVALFIDHAVASAELANAVVNATALIFGPDGNMYISDRQGDRVLRYDMSSDASGLYEEFIPEKSAGLNLPRGMVFGPDGNLYVGSQNSEKGRVLRFQGPNEVPEGSSAGDFINEFIRDVPGTTDDESGGLSGPFDLVFGSDGNSLYVTDFLVNGVMRYDVDFSANSSSVDSSGAPVGIPHGAAGDPYDAFFAGDQVHFPYSMTFGPDDNILYVASSDTEEILRYNGHTGKLIDEFVPRRGGGLSGPRFMVFGPDDNLYVSSVANGKVVRYEGPSMDQTSLPVAVVEVSTFSSSDVGLEIPDLSTITSTLLIPSGIGDITIRDLNVQVDITHRCLGELEAALISPGTGDTPSIRVELFNLGCKSDLTGTMFDDEGGPNRSDLIFQPKGLLSRFDDLVITAGAEWTLEISDVFNPTFHGKPKPETLEPGLLNSWSIIINQVVSGPTPGITTTPASGLVTTEAGGTDTFTVVLDAPPTADVTIDIESNDTTEGAVVLSSLTFTRANWDQPQTVTVTGVNDEVVDGDVPYAITLTPDVGASEYLALGSEQVSATNLDNEVPAASSDDIYVSDISFNSRTRGKGGLVHDEQIVVTVWRDADANGADTDDQLVANATVTVELTGAFTEGGTYPVGTYSGVTDSAGVFTSGWLKDLPDGTYTAKVTDLTHASYFWKVALDSTADDVHAIPHPPSASATDAALLAWVAYDSPDDESDSHILTTTLADDMALMLVE